MYTTAMPLRPDAPPRRTALEWAAAVLVGALLALLIAWKLSSPPAAGAESAPPDTFSALAPRSHACWQAVEVRSPATPAGPYDVTPEGLPAGSVTLLLDQCSGRTWALRAAPAPHWQPIPIEAQYR